MLHISFEVNQCVYPLQQIDANTVKEVCSKYIYDQCPVVVGLGTFPCTLYHWFDVCMYFTFCSQDLLNNCPIITVSVATCTGSKFRKRVLKVHVNLEDLH